MGVIALNGYKLSFNEGKLVCQTFVEHSSVSGRFSQFI